MDGADGADESMDPDQYEPLPKRQKLSNNDEDPEIVHRLRALRINSTHNNKVQFGDAKIKEISPRNKGWKVKKDPPSKFVYPEGYFRHDFIRSEVLRLSQQERIEFAKKRSTRAILRNQNKSKEPNKSIATSRTNHNKHSSKRRPRGPIRNRGRVAVKICEKKRNKKEMAEKKEESPENSPNAIV